MDVSDFKTELVPVTFLLEFTRKLLKGSLGFVKHSSVIYHPLITDVEQFVRLHALLFILSVTMFP